MKFHSSMIIVEDIEKSKRFYTDILHETIMLDLGTTSLWVDFSMMTRQTWKEDTNDAPIPDKYAGHCFELYFEEDRLDDFIAQLHKNDGIKEFQPLTEAQWGQRTIRFLDPDNHVIEVAEPMEEVILRLLTSGMTEQETADKTMMPLELVQKCRTEHGKGIV